MNKEKIEFPFNLYVGKHMKEPLRVKHNGIIQAVREIKVSNSEIKFVWCGSSNVQHCLSKNTIKPQLKSLDSLSDDEWLFVFGSIANDIKITRTSILIKVVNKYDELRVYMSYNLERRAFTYGSQQQFNRLHSLHRSENEKALLEAELIEIVE